jgi:hypothetical protein
LALQQVGSCLRISCRQLRSSVTIEDDPQRHCRGRAERPKRVDFGEHIGKWSADMKLKISLVSLGLRDFSKALTFYRDGRGFPVHSYTEGEDFCILRLEGTWLSLYPRDNWQKTPQCLITELGLPASPLRTM